jgi:hypothetical protein
MNTWTALILSRETTRELQRDAAQHRLAKLAAAPARAHRNAARQKTATQQESPREGHPRLRQLPRLLRLYPR